MAIRYTLYLLLGMLKFMLFSYFTECTSEKAHSFRGGMIASSGTGCLQTPHVPDVLPDEMHL